MQCLLARQHLLCSLPDQHNLRYGFLLQAQLHNQLAVQCTLGAADLCLTMATLPLPGCSALLLYMQEVDTCMLCQTDRLASTQAQCYVAHSLMAIITCVGFMMTQVSQLPQLHHFLHDIHRRFSYCANVALCVQLVPPKQVPTPKQSPLPLPVYMYGLTPPAPPLSQLAFSRCIHFGIACLVTAHGSSDLQMLLSTQLALGRCPLNSTCRLHNALLQ